MPAVTGIRHTRSGRVRVTLDEHVELDLSSAAATKHDLRAGRELTRPEADAVHAAAALEAADRAALRYLAYRPRSRLELERYLRGKRHDPAVIAEVVASCVDAGHIDDEAFALAYALDRIRLRPRGTWRIEAELRQRGVEAATASAAVARALAQEGVTERELIENLARRRWERTSSLDPAVARRRLEAFLRRRGFAADGIADVLRELEAAAPEPPDGADAPAH